MKRFASVVAVSMILVLVVPASPALARIDTDTTGKICGYWGCGDRQRRRMETFSGYPFKGRTSPSSVSGRVVFHYQKPDANGWTKFGAGLQNNRRAFRGYRANHVRVRSDGSWNLNFVPYRPGWWIVRAKFQRTARYRSSNVKKWLKVNYSD